MHGRTVPWQIEYCIGINKNQGNSLFFSAGIRKVPQKIISKSTGAPETDLRWGGHGLSEVL